MRGNIYKTNSKSLRCLTLRAVDPELNTMGKGAEGKKEVHE
jgi:hypothetical protein